MRLGAWQAMMFERSQRFYDGIGVDRYRSSALGEEPRMARSSDKARQAYEKAGVIEYYCHVLA